MTTNEMPGRRAKLVKVMVDDIHTSPVAQRALRPAWAQEIANNFDPDMLEVPELSHRDGKYYVVDGQHRIEGLRLMGWGDQYLECWVTEGLTEAEEAALFLGLNNRKTVNSYDRFEIALVARRPVEVEIQEIVQEQGLKISRDGEGISAVSALCKVYALGTDVLARTLAIIRDAYGASGLSLEIIHGVGLLIARHGATLDDEVVVARLGALHGGANGLRGRAQVLRRQLGRPIGMCVAGSAVEVINRGRGGGKLPNWWS